MSVSTLFKKYLVFLQREQPLIHLLSDEMQALLRQVMRRFLKQECDISGLSTYLGWYQIKVVNRGCSCIATNLGSYRIQTQWV